jgi:hypothetical protein
MFLLSLSYLAGGIRKFLRAATLYKGMRSTITFLNSQHVENVRNEQYALLHARDEYSKLRWAKLRALVPEAGLIELVFSRENERAACARWMLRGLRLPHAVRKVDYDVRCAETIRQQKHKEKLQAVLVADVIG